MSDNIFPITEKVKTTLPAVTSQQRPYQAFTVSERERGELGLLIYYEDGESEEVIYYAYLMRAIVTDPISLCLMCTDCVYTVWGKNLKPLMPLLSEHKIRSLQAFTDQKHLPFTAENDEMVIESISLQSNEDWWQEYEKRQLMREKQAQDELAALANSPAPQE